MADRDEATCKCARWCRAYGLGEPGEKHHRDCEHWRREHKDAQVIQTRTELIVLGTPDDGDEGHSCDLMGCSTVSHVIFRAMLFDVDHSPLSDAGGVALPRVTDDDLTEMEQWLAGGGADRAVFFPVDARKLAGFVKCTVAELRAARNAGVKTPGEGRNE